MREVEAYVCQAQPGALLCSRIRKGLGDYESKGDMEVPARNSEGLWETCDTTNDSWSYAWYDQNWRDARTILHRLVSTVGRGGTYLLNIGPDNNGRVPQQASNDLRKAGEWIRRYPQVVYGAGPSPWEQAMPWGDVTTAGDNVLNLVVFDWPSDGRLCLPGLQTEIAEAGILANGKIQPITWQARGAWTELRVPAAMPDRPASVVRLTLKGAVKVDPTPGIHPNVPVTLLAEFAEASGAEQKRIRWMEKFGEWKAASQISAWGAEGKAVWTVEVCEAGNYRIDLDYTGEDRLVWRIDTDEGVSVQNQQNATAVYQTYPFGLLTFKKPGKHTLTVSLVEGDRAKASLRALQASPTE